MKTNSVPLVVLLLVCLFPAVLAAQPDKHRQEFAPVDTCGDYVLFGKKSGSPSRFSEFYLKNTTTDTKLVLSMTNVSRYDFQHGFLLSYGSMGIDVYRVDGSLMVKTGMTVLDFLPGDTLFSVYNFDSDWKIYSTSSELIASGEGVPWHGYTFKQTYDSLIIVPGPNKTVGLINTRGFWLALPVFSGITAEGKNTLRATIGYRYGVLDANGIFHEPDSTLTDVSVHTIVRGIGTPHRVRNASESSRDPNLKLTILDLFHEFIVASDPSPDMGCILLNLATKETFKLPVRQNPSFAFDYPFLRMKYYNAPLYREALLDFTGNLLTENASYINVVRNGDSSVIIGTGCAWHLYDWEMNILNSSAMMKLPNGDGQSIRALTKGLYAVSVIYDTSKALYELVDRTGRVLTDAVFTSCYSHNGKIIVQVCNGLRGELDTAGNVYYSGDRTPRRITRESLLKDRDYRRIVIEKSDRSGSRLKIRINPYCYDRHTFEKEGDWEISRWYYNGKLLAQHKKKAVKVKKSNSFRTTYRVTEIATIYKHGRKRKKVRFEYTPSWF